MRSIVDLNAKKLTINQLKSLLSERGVELPAHAQRKAYYVDLFEELQAEVRAEEAIEEDEEVEAELLEVQSSPTRRSRAQSSPRRGTRPVFTLTPRRRKLQPAADEEDSDDSSDDDEEQTSSSGGSSPSPLLVVRDLVAFAVLSAVAMQVGPVVLSAVFGN